MALPYAVTFAIQGDLPSHPSSPPTGSQHFQFPLSRGSPGPVGAGSASLALPVLSGCQDCEGLGMAERQGTGGVLRRVAVGSAGSRVGV